MITIIKQQMVQIVVNVMAIQIRLHQIVITQKMGFNHITEILYKV